MSRKHREEMTDLELIRQYRLTSKQRYVGTLYTRYAHLVYGVCMKYLKNKEESQDAVMLIFEKLLQDLKTHDVSNFKPWLHTVSRNHCLMHLRKFSRVKDKEISFEDVAYKMEQAELEDEESILKERKLQQLEESMQNLKEEHKICLELFYLKQKSYKEVADITGYSMKEVKSYIQNGKRNLKLTLTPKL